jgi:proline iminopeptidase
MPRHPLIQPYETGFLDVGEGQRLYWQACGNPAGKPAIVVHGGPGSGAAPGFRRFFDAARWRVVLFDQRGCGRSTPSAADIETDLTVNDTQRLIADMERLREHLAIERWTVVGGSWGSCLGLAYIQAHPGRVTEAALFSIALGGRREIDWITRGVSPHFPEAWAKFRDGVPPADRDGDLADAYARRLASPDPAVREQAAADWCAWEDAHVAVSPDHRHDPRYDDPRFRMTFARLVTHYWRNACFLAEGQLLAGASALGHIPAALIHGARDVSTPDDNARDLHQAWPGSTLTIVGEAGHGAGQGGLGDAVADAVAQFAR